MNQQTMDFERAEKLGILDRAIIPKAWSISEGKTSRSVTGTLLALLLRVIDSFARNNDWCYPSQELLAQRCNCSVRSIRRALTVLEHEMVLAVERRRIDDCTRSRYKLIWSNLAALADAHSQAGQPAQGAAYPGGATGPEGRLVGGQPAHRGGVTGPQRGGDRPTEGGVTGPGGRLNVRETYETALNVNVDAEVCTLRPPDGERWRRMATQVASKIPIRDPRDRQLIANLAAAAVAGRMPENVLWESVEAVEIIGPRNPAAYLHSIVKTKLAAAGQQFAAVVCPSEFGR